MWLFSVQANAFHVEHLKIYVEIFKTEEITTST
jgi:hypothetical protein